MCAAEARSPSSNGGRGKLRLARGQILRDIAITSEMEALQLLLNDLEDDDREAVWEAARQLQSIGVEIVTGALKLLKDAKRAETRAAAAYVLGSCRLSSARVHLEQTVENEREAASVRHHAAEALGYLQSRESVPVLVRQLEGDKAGV